MVGPSLARSSRQSMPIPRYSETPFIRSCPVEHAGATYGQGEPPPASLGVGSAHLAGPGSGICGGSEGALESEGGRSRARGDPETMAESQRHADAGWERGLLDPKTPRNHQDVGIRSRSWRNPIRHPRRQSTGRHSAGLTMTSETRKSWPAVAGPGMPMDEAGMSYVHLSISNQCAPCGKYLPFRG